MRDPVAYFDEWAQGYASWTTSGVTFTERLGLFDRAIRKCRSDAPTDLCLDLGCGNGQLTFLAQRLGFEAVGIDGATEMIRLASSRARAEKGPIFRCERLPLREETVDELRAQAALVMASSVI